MQYRVRLIAEETNDDGLRIDGVTRTICDEVAQDLLHNKSLFVDPTNDERTELGIENVDVVRTQISFEAFMRAPPGTGQDDIGRDSIVRETANSIAADPRICASHEEREREWLRRLKGQGVFPVLLVCGADHVRSFTDLARSDGLAVTIAYSDWEPPDI